MLETQWITDPDRFLALEEEWARLLPGTDVQPYDLHCWYRVWWEAFGGDAELTVCTVRRDGELVGAFPMMRRGRRLSPLLNDQTDMTRPLAVDEEALEALVDALLEADRGRIEFHWLPAGDPGRAALERRAAAAGRPTLTTDAHAAPYIDTRGDFGAWKEENKHRWESSLDRKRRKMERDFTAEFRLLESPEDLDARLDEGLRIEASGWKGREGTAIASSPRTLAFYRGLADAFQRRGELRFNWIVLDGEPVAFSFNILVGNRLYSLKSGFDEDYRKFSPGLVMRLAMIEACFEAGIESHELLGEAVGWKTYFCTGTHPHVDVRVYPRGLRGRFGRGYRTSVRPRLSSAYHRVRRRR